MILNSFCCNIQIVQLKVKFGMTTWKYPCFWTIPSVMGPVLQTDYCLDATWPYLSLYNHIFWWLLPAGCHLTSQQISNWFLVHDNDFTVLRRPPQSPDRNLQGKFASWMWVHQICAICVMLSWQYVPKSLMRASGSWLNRCLEELRQFWREKGVKPNTSKANRKKSRSIECIFYFSYKCESQHI